MGCRLLRFGPPRKYRVACPCPPALWASTARHLVALDFFWHRRSPLLTCLHRMYNNVSGKAPPVGVPLCSLSESQRVFPGVLLHAFRAPGLELPHVAQCPPGVRASAPCSSVWVVSASLGLRALDYFGPVLLWSAALRGPAAPILLVPLPPPKKHNHFSFCEVPPRTAAIYKLSLQQISAYALLGGTIGYQLPDPDQFVG